MLSYRNYDFLQDFISLYVLEITHLPLETQNTKGTAFYFLLPIIPTTISGPSVYKYRAQSHHLSSQKTPTTQAKIHQPQEIKFCVSYLFKNSS